MKLGITILVLIILGVFGVMAVSMYMKNSEGYTQNSESNTKTKDSTQTANTSETPAVQAQNTVEIKGFAFTPSELKVKKGTTVAFINKDSMDHSATSTTQGIFDTGLFGQGEEKSVTLNTVGTFDYSCTPHPFMKGKIIVE